MPKLQCFSSEVFAKMWSFICVRDSLLRVWNSEKVGSGCQLASNTCECHQLAECDTLTQLLCLVFRIELVVICWISTATSGNISAGCHLFRLVLKLLSGGNLGYLELTWSFAFGEPEERIISRGAFQEVSTWLTVEVICLIYTALSVAAESLTVSYRTQIHIPQEMKANLKDCCIRI